MGKWITRIRPGRGLACIGVIVTTILIVLREPRYFYQPRFWAEEGSLHFAYSYSHNWWAALFQPQVGYLNFWPNLATLLAVLPPLEFAPYVTTFMALLIQLVPVVFILSSKSPIWSSWIRKLVALAIFLFSALTGEVWLNTINSYSFMAIVTFLILLEETPADRIRRWIYRFLLVVGGLTGTVSCFLIPLFGLRALVEKEKERWFQVLFLSACTLVQIILIFRYRSNESFGDRFHLIGLTTLGVTIWTQSLALFAFGFQQADEWARVLFSMASQDLGSFQMWGRILLLSAGILFLLFSSNLSILQRVLFIGGYVILLVLPMMFSVIKDKYALIDTGLHQRIFLAPNILLGWMLLFGIRFRNEKGWRVPLANLISLLCALMVAASLFWGMQSYREPWFVAEYWPDWKAETEIWEADPTYALKIQPEGWVINLSQP